VGCSSVTTPVSVPNKSKCSSNRYEHVGSNDLISQTYKSNFIMPCSQDISSPTNMADSNLYSKNDEMKLEEGIIEGKLDSLRFIRLFKSDG